MLFRRKLEFKGHEEIRDATVKRLTSSYGMLRTHEEIVYLKRHANFLGRK